MGRGACMEGLGYRTPPGGPEGERPWERPEERTGDSRPRRSGGSSTRGTRFPSAPADRYDVAVDVPRPGERRPGLAGLHAPGPRGEAAEGPTTGGEVVSTRYAGGSTLPSTSLGRET